VKVRDDEGTTLYNVYGSLVHRGSVAQSVFRWGYPADVRNRLSKIRFVKQGQV